MLHHYNYGSPLSHFLSYHQLEDQSENGQMTPLCEEIGQRILDPHFKSMSGAGANKSFTIAAILGLHTDRDNPDMQTSPTDLSAVVNLSVHQNGGERSLVSGCTRLQLPARGQGSAGGVTGHFPGGPSRPGGKGLKHLSSSAINNSKKSCKSKRVRTIFTPDQLERLEAEFERQQYMVGPERLYLAHTLQLTEAQVKVWFQNRRIKWRKHHLEMTQQRLAALKQQQILLGDVHQDTQDTNSSGTDT